MAKLVVISNSYAGLSHQLGRRWVTIGRDPGNLFQITESSVSGQHCEVLLQGTQLLVRDLRSTNGTYIKDTLITEGVVGMGGLLRLGDVELRFEAGPSPSLYDPAQREETRYPIPALPASNGNFALRKHQLLLVDDSMAFLEMASEMFESLANGGWEIHKACGADQALSIIQERQIELAVLDINMPMLDGQQLLGMLHRRHPEVKLVILTAHADETRRAQCLAAGAELFLEKPITQDGMRFVFNVLNDSITWKRREGFTGTLEQVSLADVIQIECLRRNSCILEIRATQLQGEIYIESGAMVHAVTGGISGVKALHRLLALNDGRFHLCPYRQPSERTIQGSWECLLMESAQLRDEERGTRDKTTFLTRPAAELKSLPQLNSHPAPKPDPGKTPAQPEAPNTPELGNGIIVVSTYDGNWHPADGKKP